MPSQISSQAAFSSSGKVTLSTRGKDVLKRVFRFGVDKGVCQACVCHRFYLLKSCCGLFHQADTHKDLAEASIVDKRENELVRELSTRLWAGSEDYMMHTSSSPSLTAFRSLRKYVHLHFTQHRRLSLPSGTRASH